MEVYGDRTQKLPAPPSVVWADLVERRAAGTRAWLVLECDEVVPEVVESSPPTLVVWSSLWPSRPGDLVRMELSDDPAGCLLRFRLLSDAEPPDQSTTGHLRKRINHLLYADLRFSYGQ